MVAALAPRLIADRYIGVPVQHVADRTRNQRVGIKRRVVFHPVLHTPGMGRLPSRVTEAAENIWS